MKNLKILFLLSFGLFLMSSSVQAQAKKSCKMPCAKTCTKAKTANVEISDYAMHNEKMTNQETTSKTSAMKNCDPKNCNAKKSSAGCDISKCKKGIKSSATAVSLEKESKATGNKGKKTATASTTPALGKVQVATK